MLSNESKFEKLLSILINAGYDEETAAGWIADAIDEQYELDRIGKEIANKYKEAKEIADKNELKYVA